MVVERQSHGVVMHKSLLVGALVAMSATNGYSNPTSPNQGKSSIASVAFFIDTVTTVPGAELYLLGTKVIDTLGQPQPSYPLAWISSDPTKRPWTASDLFRFWQPVR